MNPASNLSEETDSKPEPDPYRVHHEQRSIARRARGAHAFTGGPRPGFAGWCLRPSSHRKTWRSHLAGAAAREWREKYSLPRPQA